MEPPVFSIALKLPNKIETGVSRMTTKTNGHPTVKSTKLMSYLIRLVTPKGGKVLDPFMGSGSTGVAAKDEGFEFVGIEKDETYFETAKKRLKQSPQSKD